MSGFRIFRIKNEYGFSDEEVLRYQSDITGIPRVKDFVPCHEIPVLLKSVAGNDGIFQVNFPVAGMEGGMGFIIDESAKKREIDGI